MADRGAGVISVVIPAFDEAQVLPNTLRALFTQIGDYEIIVVDGGSTDRTREVVQEFALSSEPSTRSPIHLLTAPKGRASQMNAGAKQATGEWFLFLHADTILPSGAIQRLNELESDENIQAGGFMHQFSGDDWRLKLISFLDNFRCIRSRIIYGDQAMFVRRTLFEHLGEFPNQPILEDVAFCEKLIKVTKPVLLTSPVVTDARKFLKMGVWRSFIRVLFIILHVEFRLPVLPRSFFQDVR
jgi:rSAM/selenodomain-associated transferase 2